MELTPNYAQEKEYMDNRVSVFSEINARELSCYGKLPPGITGMDTLIAWQPDPDFNKRINSKLSLLPPDPDFRDFTGDITLYRGMSTEEVRAMLACKYDEAGIHYTHIRDAAGVYALWRGGLVCEVTVPAELIKFFLIESDEVLIPANMLKPYPIFFYQVLKLPGPLQRNIFEKTRLLCLYPPLMYRRINDYSELF